MVAQRAVASAAASTVSSYIPAVYSDRFPQ